MLDLPLTRGDRERVRLPTCSITTSRTIRSASPATLRLHRRPRLELRRRAEGRRSDRSTPALFIIFRFSTKPRSSSLRCSARAAPRTRAEIIVVDGGSTTRPPRSRRSPTASSPRARPRAQMNAGPRRAGDILLFLHADTRLPPGATADPRGPRAIAARLGPLRYRDRRPHPLLPSSPRSMNARSRLSGIATGDQAMFVTRMPSRGRRFPSRTDGGHRLSRAPEALVACRFACGASRRRAGAGSARRVAHDPADVAAAPFVFLRGLAGQPCHADTSCRMSSRKPRSGYPGSIFPPARIVRWVPALASLDRDDTGACLIRRAPVLSIRCADGCAFPTLSGTALLANGEA